MEYNKILDWFNPSMEFELKQGRGRMRVIDHWKIIDGKIYFIATDCFEQFVKGIDFTNPDKKLDWTKIKRISLE